jgi:hypothetical protein
MLKEFHFNVYIRYYMLCYFDLTFFSVMKLAEGNNSTSLRQLASKISIFFASSSILIPICLITFVFLKFKVFRIKNQCRFFKTLLLKIDKKRRRNALVPCVFFARRFFVTMVLAFPLENRFAFIQYAAVTITSNIWAICLANMRPYK